MKGISFQQLWEENKKFCLIVGGGLLIFLILNSYFVSGSKSAAEKLNREIKAPKKGLESQVASLHKLLRDRYNIERNLGEDYKEVELALLKKFSMRPPGVKVPEVKKNVEIYYGEKLSQIWKGLSKKKSAFSLACDLPQQLSPQDLEIETNASQLFHLSYHVELELIKRGLNILLDSGMNKIERFRSQGEEEYNIKNNETHKIIYQKISYTAYGPYEAFVKALNLGQKTEGGFMQVHLRDLNSKGSKDSTRLRGVLEFSTFFLEELQEEEGEL